MSWELRKSCSTTESLYQLVKLYPDNTLVDYCKELCTSNILKKSIGTDKSLSIRRSIHISSNIVKTTLKIINREIEQNIPFHNLNIFYNPDAIKNDPALISNVFNDFFSTSVINIRENKSSKNCTSTVTKTSANRSIFIQPWH